MSKSDLIWLTPWAVFGVALTAMLLRLHRTRRSARRASPPRPRARARAQAQQPAAGRAGHGRRLPERAGSTRGRQGHDRDAEPGPGPPPG